MEGGRVDWSTQSRDLHSNQMLDREFAGSSVDVAVVIASGSPQWQRADSNLSGFSWSGESGSLELDISTAQSDLRRAYVHGGPGTVVSGLVWLLAGLMADYSDISTGFGVLFFGGMLIFPITSLIVRSGLKRGPVSKSNPGGWTVIETVFPMIGGLLAAWLLLPFRPDLVFSIAAIAVGAHYFGFRTAYGMTSYWILASILCLIGVAAVFLKFPMAGSVPFVVAAVEIVFGCWLTWEGTHHDSV